MEKKQNKLDQLKGQNPFKVPDGYMEGLSSRIMDQLPEKTQQEAKTVSMIERIRPWLYMAAVFGGLLLCFKAFFSITGSENPVMPTDSLLVHTQIASEPRNALIESEEFYDEDEEYMEYIENQYASYILAEETAFSE